MCGKKTAPSNYVDLFWIASDRANANPTMTLKISFSEPDVNDLFAMHTVGRIAKFGVAKS